MAFQRGEVACSGAGGAAGRVGTLAVCADGWAAVVPAGDTQAVPRPAVAGTTTWCGWHLAAAADRGYGRCRRAGWVEERAVAALGARDDPGTPGSAVPASAPASDGRRRAGHPGERPAPVAGGRAGGAGQGRGAGGGRRQWRAARGGSRDVPAGEPSARA